jgi:hypothetical protein
MSDQQQPVPGMHSQGTRRIVRAIHENWRTLDYQRLKTAQSKRRKTSAATSYRMSGDFRLYAALG